jgi:hypothetical protein
MQLLKVKPRIMLRRMFARLVRTIYRIQNISHKHQTVTVNFSKKGGLPKEKV